MAPVVFAEIKRDGFPEFLKKAPIPLAIEMRNGLVAFGPDRAAVEQFAPALDATAGSFQGTPFYARIAEAYRDGAGLLLCADLSRMGRSEDSPLSGVRYVIAEQKEVNHQMEARASMGFDGSRTGISGWLAEPAPMGSLDYVSPDATFLAAFVTRDAGATSDAVTGLVKKTAVDLGPNGLELRNDLAASLRRIHFGARWPDISCAFLEARSRSLPCGRMQAAWTRPNRRITTQP